MLPSLRIILAAVIAACAAVVTLSAGLVGARDPARNIAGVPDLSRTLVRQAIVEEPEQQSQPLAYSSRRADELLRLRDLPVTPVRAVVEYAEQAQARAAEAASSPAPEASETGAVIVATAPASADGPREPAVDSATVAATSPADMPPPAPMIATAPAANPPSDTTATTTVVAAPVTTPPADGPSIGGPASLPAVAAPATAAPAETAVAAVANATPATASAASAPAGGDTQVAAVQTGGSETAEMYGPVRPAADAKPRRGGKTVHTRPAKPKKKPQVARAPQSVAPAFAPTGLTGFQVDQPSSRPNNAFDTWRRASNEAPRGNAFPSSAAPRR